MKCFAEYIEKKIKAAPDGGICSIPKGEYYIERYINIVNRKNIVINGNGSVIVSHYNNGSSDKPTCDVFHITECKGIKLCNFVLETDTPVNITGTVKSVNKNENSYLLSVLPEFKVTGKEILMVQNSCDSDGSFDGKLEYYCPNPDKKPVLLAGEILLANTHISCKYDYLGDNCFKIYLPAGKINGVEENQTICIRHSSYGPVSILIKNSDDTAIENLTVHSAGGMGIIVLPRSENLSLNNFNVVLPKNSKRFMSCNCDGVHITGLCGKLTMKHCDFSGLGDDALNIHSTAATVTGLDSENGTLKCNYCKKGPDGILSPDWCRKGDIITVLDSVDCTKLGQIMVKTFHKDKLEFEMLSGKIQVGNVLQNTEFSAAVEIDSCAIKNTRARGFLFQTENISVKGCSFFGISSSAVLAAPDVRLWYEVGPIKNMQIANNIFKKCAFAGNEAENSIITVKNSHGRIDKISFGVHNDICLSGNTFCNKKGKCISVLSCDNFDVENNHFENCMLTDKNDAIETDKCRSIVIQNNKFKENLK